MLCSPQRLERPWQGETEAAEDDARPPYDPTCYLCPGNARAGGALNPAYASTFAFDNDFPALRLEAVAIEPRPARAPGPTLLKARAVSGACRVLCFSPRHDLTLARMEVADVRRVVDAWGAEVRQLGGLESVRYVQVFENKGAAMGCSNPHPHGQVWASSSIPSRPARSLLGQRRYHRAHGRDLLGDYLDEELRGGERLVCTDSLWVALVPFWAVWPFETMILPRRRVGDLAALTAEEKDALAEILKRLLARYDNLFGCSFPYTMGWQGRPTDGPDYPCWRLHAVFLPPLLRSAAIRKFLVGYEMTAEPQRDLAPEEAATRLRETSERQDVSRAS